MAVVWLGGDTREKILQYLSGVFINKVHVIPETNSLAPRLRLYNGCHQYEAPSDDLGFLKPIKVLEVIRYVHAHANRISYFLGPVYAWCIICIG